MALPKIQSSADVEDVLDELKNQAQFFEAVTGTEVPKNIKEAIASGWQLEAQAVVVEWLLAYGPQQRKKDHQRLMYLQDALTLIEEWEEKLIVDQVLDPIDITWKLIGVWPRLVQTVWVNKAVIWAAVKEVFQLVIAPSEQTLRKAWKIVLGGVGSALSILALAFDAGPFSTVILDILKDRDRVVRLMRKRALKQRTGRVRRRKVARV